MAPWAIARVMVLAGPLVGDGLTRLHECGQWCLWESWDAFRLDGRPTPGHVIQKTHQLPVTIGRGGNRNPPVGPRVGC